MFLSSTGLQARSMSEVLYLNFFSSFAPGTSLICWVQINRLIDLFSFSPAASTQDFKVDAVVG